MRLVAHFIKQMIASRIVVLFVVIHLLIYIYRLSKISKSPVHHPTNDPIFFQILVLLDLPALIVASFFQTSLSYDKYWWASLYNKFIVFSFLSIQWALIGFAVERIFKRLIASRLK